MNKKLIYILVIVIFIATAFYLGPQFINKKATSPELLPQPTILRSDRADSNCLTEKEIQLQQDSQGYGVKYSVNASGTYVAVLTYQEGALLISIRDTHSCQELFNTYRLATEFDRLQWNGDLFRFEMIITRHPLVGFIGEVNTKDWTIRWLDYQ